MQLPSSYNERLSVSPASAVYYPGLKPVLRFLLLWLCALTSAFFMHLFLALHCVGFAPYIQNAALMADLSDKFIKPGFFKQALRPFTGKGISMLLIDWEDIAGQLFAHAFSSLQWFPSLPFCFLKRRSLCLPVCASDFAHALTHWTRFVSQRLRRVMFSMPPSCCGRVFGYLHANSFTAAAI